MLSLRFHQNYDNLMHQKIILFRFISFGRREKKKLLDIQ